MKLVVFSHKPCWPSASSPTGFATDGGFPLQMAAMASLFDSMEVVVPCLRRQPAGAAGIPLIGSNVKVRPLSQLRGRGLTSKLHFPWWLLRNTPRIVRGFTSAHAVHAPIPGNVGTIGMLLALIARKPLFVRHCGNWRKPRSAAERFWKSTMERIAGGRNVMLATGGDGAAPSLTNPRVKWIFSSSLTAETLAAAQRRAGLHDAAAPRLVIACRQQRPKGTEKVIAAMPELLQRFPGLRLEVVGDGEYLPTLREQVAKSGLAKRVTFRGQVSQPEVLEAFRRADLFCYPTSASEGFPKVVLEALASGLPVVTTRVSVLPELLASGGGVLLDDDAPSHVAKAVIACLESPERYACMSAAAADTARSFSLERWSETIGNELRAAWGPLKSHE